MRKWQFIPSLSSLPHIVSQAIDFHLYTDAQWLEEEKLEIPVVCLGKISYLKYFARVNICEGFFMQCENKSIKIEIFYP
jgi:hypothetical protein